MLERVQLDGIQLPRLYIAENMGDVKLAKSKGIPYIKWTGGQEELIRQLLRPLLEHMFPDIKWTSVLGRRKKFRTKVIVTEAIEKPKSVIDDMSSLDNGHHDDGWMPSQDDDEYINEPEADYDGTYVEVSDSTVDERLFHDDEHELVVVHSLDIEDYIGDMSSYVDIEVLQRLRLMPAFIGDILDCVKLNMTSGVRWQEGYNKKRGLPIGRFNASPQLPNLVILDVSGSIPRGISATMISLIDTLRTQLSADLIITGSNSRFYPMGCKLPEPQRIRDMFGYGNESHDFFGILNKHICGKHYGHVFSFGDNDTPDYAMFDGSLAGTTVEQVHHYHTGFASWSTRGNLTKTGYGKWCHLLGKAPLEDYDTTWCKVMKR